MNRLENQLCQLRPAPLPARLQQRLDQAGRHRPLWPPIGWPAWVMAAGLALLLLVGVRLALTPAGLPAAAVRQALAPRTPPDCPPRVLRVLCAQRDEGLVLISANRPYRQFRRRYVASYSWDHCRSGTRQTYAVPAEEIVLVPVAVY